MKQDVLRAWKANTRLVYDKLCYAMPCYAKLCQTMLCCAVLCRAVLCCAIPCCAVLRWAISCHFMPRCGVLCRAMPCCIVLCRPMLYYDRLCYGLLSFHIEVSFRNALSKNVTKQQFLAKNREKFCFPPICESSWKTSLILLRVFFHGRLYKMLFNHFYC